MDASEVKMIPDGVRIDFMNFKVGDAVFFDVTRDCPLGYLPNNYGRILFICNMYIEIEMSAYCFREKIKYKDLLHISKVIR